MLLYSSIYSGIDDLLSTITECALLDGVERARALEKLLPDAHELEVCTHMRAHQHARHVLQALSQYTDNLDKLDAAEYFLTKLMHIEE